MERTTRKVRLCTALLVLNILLIWGNSLLPGPASAALSGWVKNLLSHILPVGQQDPESGHGLLRKLAHVAEFTCVGVLFAWLYAMLQKRAWWALACGFLVACVDETIQRFVPGRGPSFTDVLIDTAGAFLGILILRMGHTVYRNKLKSYEEETRT